MQQNKAEKCYFTLLTWFHSVYVTVYIFVCSIKDDPLRTDPVLLIALLLVTIVILNEFKQLFIFAVQFQ